MIHFPQENGSLEILENYTSLILQVGICSVHAKCMLTSWSCFKWREGLYDIFWFKSGSRRYWREYLDLLYKRKKSRLNKLA